MSYYSSIYGLEINLNQQVPGIALYSSSSRPIDIQIHFGSMPSWFRPDHSPKELWYVSPERQPGADPRLVVWKLVDANHYQIRYADGTQFLLDKSGTNIWATWPSETLTLEDTATYLLGPVMGFVLLLRGCVALHASAVAVGNRAVALVGPARSGKSTTAAVLADLGYSILAEDVVTLQDFGNVFLVQPGYPCIRLWPSSVKALYGQDAELPKLTPTWDKCYLDLTQDQYEFQKDPLPLAALYLLDERTEASTSPSVHEVSPGEGLISLIANTYATHLMDKKMRAREFELLDRVVKNLPIRRLVPHSDPAHIGALCRTIIENFEAIDTGEPASRTSEQALNV